MFGKSIFVDHVGHTGPCDAPEYVVAIEMKRGSDKTLRRQVWKLDIYHVADEVWGFTMATPREATVAKWVAAFKGGRWSKHGLMSFDTETKDFVEHVAAERLDDAKKHRNRHKLLLCEQNRDQLAGYPSGAHTYCTHYKLTRAWVRASLEAGEVKPLKLAKEAPHYATLYKNVSSSVSRILRELEKEGEASKVGRGVWASTKGES